MTPSSATAPRQERKKRYSIDAGYPPEHLDGSAYYDPYAREAYDRRDYQGSTASIGRKGYHLTGPSGRPQDFDDDSYSYTDAAGMYRDTEPPRWRPRSGSVDRGPERPRSLYDTYGPRELGPPPTTRGFDRLGDYYQGPQGPRDIAASPNRRTSVRSAYPVGDPYADPVRAPPRRQPAIHQDRDDRRYDPKASNNSHNIPPRHGRGAEGDGMGQRDYVPKDDSKDRHGRYRDAYDDEPPYRPAERRELLSHPHAPHNDDRQERLARRKPEIVAEPDNIHPPISERDGNVYHNDRRDRYDDYDKDRLRSASNHHGENGHTREAVPAALGAAGVAAAGLAAKAGVDAGSRRETGADGLRDPDRRDHYRAQEREPGTDDVPYRNRHRDYHEESDRRRKADRDEQRSPDGAEYRERHYVEATQDQEGEDRRRGPQIVNDPDEDYRRRVQREIEQTRTVAEPRESVSLSNSKSEPSSSVPRAAIGTAPAAKSGGEDSTAIAVTAPSDSSSGSDPESAGARHHRHRRHHQPADDNLASSSSSSTRENRVRIVPPSKHSRSRRGSSPPDPANATAVKGILRKPTEKFPEDPNPVLEGVAPLKDASKKKGIPPDARWTKIARRMVNPEALEEAKERFVERLDCVIVLRVLTKEEVQKLATRTAEIRGMFSFYSPWFFFCLFNLLRYPFCTVYAYFMFISILLTYIFLMFTEEREHEENDEQSHRDGHRHRDSKTKQRSRKSRHEGVDEDEDDDDKKYHHRSSSSSSDGEDDDDSSSDLSSRADDDDDDGNNDVDRHRRHRHRRHHRHHRDKRRGHRGGHDGDGRRVRRGERDADGSDY